MRAMWLSYGAAVPARGYLRQCHTSPGDLPQCRSGKYLALSLLASGLRINRCQYYGDPINARTPRRMSGHFGAALSGYCRLLAASGTVSHSDQPARFLPYLQCRDCGVYRSAPIAVSPFTYHRRDRTLKSTMRCFTAGPSVCVACSSPALYPFASARSNGKVLRAMFPGARLAAWIRGHRPAPKRPHQRIFAHPRQWRY